MMKYITAAAVSAFAMTAISVPAVAAVSITDSVSCQAEGGTMVNVKNSDYCLVSIRDAEYADPVYDGNQLGIVECPGDKLNDGKYCMYPVTIRPAPVVEPAPEPAAELDVQIDEAAVEAAADVMNAAADDK